VTTLDDLKVSELARIRTTLNLALFEKAKLSAKARFNRSERLLRDYLESEWEDLSEDEIDELIEWLEKREELPTERQLNEKLAALGVGMATLGTVTSKRAKRIIDQMYRATAETAAGVAGIDLVHAPIDTKTVNALSRLVKVSVGEHYSKHMADRIRAVANDIAYEQGLTVKEATKKLRSALRDEFKKPGITREALGVPPGFNGTTRQYFQVVAETASVRAQSMAQVTAFEKANVESFVFWNPMDQRTTEQCAMLFGTVFTVDMGIAQRDAILAADSMDEVREVAPFVTGADVAEITGVPQGTRGGLTDQNEALARAGVVMPPLHSRCRSQINPI
jgi:hypothetical protein